MYKYTYEYIHVSCCKLTQQCQELQRHFCEECFKYEPPLPSLFTPVYSSLPFIVVSDVIVTIMY